MTIPVTRIERRFKQWSFPKKNRMFGGIGAMALAFTLAVVGVDAFAKQAQTADMKVDSKLQSNGDFRFSKSVHSFVSGVAGHGADVVMQADDRDASDPRDHCGFAVSTRCVRTCLSKSRPLPGGGDFANCCSAAVKTP